MTYLLTLYRISHSVSVPITAETFEEASEIADKLAGFSSAQSIALHTVNNFNPAGRTLPLAAGRGWGIIPPDLPPSPFITLEYIK